MGTGQPQFYALLTVSLLHLLIHHSGVFCKIQGRVSKDLQCNLVFRKGCPLLQCRTKPTSWAASKEETPLHASRP